MEQLLKRGQPFGDQTILAQNTTSDNVNEQFHMIMQRQSAMFRGENFSSEAAQLSGKRQQQHSKENIKKSQQSGPSNRQHGSEAISHFPSINPNKARVNSSRGLKQLSKEMIQREGGSEKDLTSSSIQGKSTTAFLDLSNLNQGQNDANGMNSPLTSDNFTRANKFKHRFNKGQLKGENKNSLKKTRYSCHDVVQQFSTTTTTGGPNATTIVSKFAIVEEEDRNTLEPLVSGSSTVLDLVKQGRRQQSYHSNNQLKSKVALKNPLSSNSIIASGQQGKSANNTAALCFDPSSSGAASLSFPTARRSLSKPNASNKCTLPSGCARNDGDSQVLISINTTTLGGQQQPSSSANTKDKSRKISLSTMNNQIGRESYSLSVITPAGQQEAGMTERGMLSARGPGEKLLNSTQLTSINHSNGGPKSLLVQIWQRLFEARCEDLALRANEKQLQRFLKSVDQYHLKRKLDLKEMGLAQKSAGVLSQLVKVGNAFADWTHIDLSMNKISMNLDPLIKALRSNTRLVQLRLSNNEISGNQNIQLLKHLVKTHPTLFDLDLSNDESSQNKNKLGNCGFEALMEGVLDSQTSVLSMLNLAENNILSTFPETFNLLKVFLTLRSEQIISLNLSGNDLGPDFISTLGKQALSNLVELSLSSTRLSNKTLGDLSEYYTDSRLQFQNLDLSSNNFTAEGLFKLFNSLKGTQVLKRLNLSRNDFNLEETGACGSYFTITELFISQNRSLEELNLDDCKLGPLGAAVIGKSLRRNQRLSKLSLAQNKFGDKGVLSLLEGVLDNMVAQSVSPFTDLDLAKNDIELKDLKARQTLTKILCEAQSRLTNLSLRDNLIRDEAADSIQLALKQNLTIMKFQIDMNPIKHATLKEIEMSIKRNIAHFKEKQAPTIQKEIAVLYEEGQKVLEDLPFKVVPTSGAPASLTDNFQQSLLLQTAFHLDERVKHYEQKSHMYKRQFMEDDRKLDMIRDEALHLEGQLVGERERVRERFRDVDFEEEQLEVRIGRQERLWAKQIGEQQEKVEIVKLAQSKALEERARVEKELQRRRDGHNLQVEAWKRELNVVLREQAVSAMIQESYVKEIDRVKKQQAMALEEAKLDLSDANCSSFHHHPPTTASSAGNRFQRKNGKRGSSTLRKIDNTSLVNDFQVGKRTVNAGGGATTIRASQSIVKGVGASLPLQISQNQSHNTSQQMPGSPEKKIRELQKLKRQIKQQRRQTEAEMGRILHDKENFTSIITKGLLGEMLGEQKTKARGDFVPHQTKQQQEYEYRLPAQMNFP